MHGDKTGTKQGPWGTQFRSHTAHWGPQGQWELMLPVDRGFRGGGKGVKECRREREGDRGEMVDPYRQGQTQDERGTRASGLRIWILFG